MDFTPDFFSLNGFFQGTTETWKREPVGLQALFREQFPRRAARWELSFVSYALKGIETEVLGRSVDLRATFQVISFESDERKRIENVVEQEVSLMWLPAPVDESVFSVMGVPLVFSAESMKARVSRHVRALAVRAELRLPWCFDCEPTPEILLGESF